MAQFVYAETVQQRLERYKESIRKEMRQEIADAIEKCWINLNEKKPMTTKEYVAWEMAHALASDTHDWNQ